MLKIYNTLTRQKEEFKPIVAGKVGMYVCGVTIYDHCHIGHGRTFVAFDTVARYFRFSGYDLKFVRNITDVDVKIIKRAAENNESCDQLTERFTNAMHADFDALNMIRPDIEPRVTTHMDEIIDIVKTLVAKKHAYVSENGDVLFSVESFDRYGQLSGQNLEMLQAGARVEESARDNKENPMDFVLWKMAKAGEPYWESPWGNGRPGWHIECSAMNKKHLGEVFDIHGGGSDLSFPHHENEVAQSCCAHDGEYVNTWMHSGMVQIDKVKMSKSLNNYIGVADSANDMFGKIMSVSDELMWRYYELLSEKSLEDIATMKDNVQKGALHPKIVKENLALELVTRFYNEELATLAKEEFDNVFKANKLPIDMNEVEVEEGIWICKALVDAGIEPSTSQARRDIKQNAVSIDQKKISDDKLNLSVGEYILQVGKRRFAKVKVG